MHRRLRRAVGEHARQRLEPAHRAEVNDVAALAARDEIFAEHLAGEVKRLEVRVHDAVELLLGDIEKWRRRIHARAVDDNVHLAGLRENVCKQRFERGLGGDVRLREPRLAADRRDALEPRIGLLRIAPDEHNFRARLREALGHRATKFAGAANDDRDFSVQAKQGFQVIRHKLDGVAGVAGRTVARRMPLV